MFRQFLLAKIHGAIVSESNLDYSGSIGISKEFLEASGIKKNEKVEIYNVSNGNRFSTYVIEESQAGKIIINGAAAHLAKEGDKLIIASYIYLDSEEILNHKATKVFVNESNEITDIETV